MIFIGNQLLNLQRVRPRPARLPGLVSPAEVRLYFRHVLGDQRVPHDRCGCWGECLFRRHLNPIYINFETGRWQCAGGCGNGDIVKFEMNRSRITDYEKGKEAVLEIIAAAQDEPAELANRSARTTAGQMLPVTTVADADAMRLLACITRHPGMSRRYFHQLSHWGAKRFNRAIGRLEREGLVQVEDRPSTGGRRRRTYSPSSPRELSGSSTERT